MAMATAIVNAKMKADNLPWVEKYRPNTLDELISHGDILTTIQRFIDEGKLPHLLFYGPPGTGKTSTIKACATMMYGASYKSMCLELNASDSRGIDVVRNQIKTFAGTKTVFKSTGVKLVILDEADAMTNDAQAALRRVIEKYSKNTRFCMICNYVSKITPALQSRCTRFRFAPLTLEQMTVQINRVAKAENLTLTEDGSAALVRLAHGDMRRALNVMQSTSMAYPVVNMDNVYTVTGHPLETDIEAIVGWLMNSSFSDCYTNISALKTDKGLALQDMLEDIHEFMYKIDFPAKVRIFLLEKFAVTEERLAGGADETMQLSALIGAFKRAIALVEEPL